MKTFAGNRWAVCWITWIAAGLLTLLPVLANARMTAEIDRVDIAVGETLRLTLKGDAGEDPSEVDLTELQKDFEVLQRSSQTSARIVGGEQSVTRTYELELAPRRDGVLTIPSFIYDGRKTTPIAVKVSPQPDIAMDDELVYFDAEIDRSEIYVQAQTILTITLQQAINLDNRAVSELEIPNTYIEPLEQKSFQRRVAGRLWQVTELRYALFPQQSGDLEIPAISFSGRELLPGRSLLGARLGRRIALQSDPIVLKVKPVPASFPGDVWLPARRLDVTSRWSSAPDKLGIGDSTTRSIEITAEGLQGSQLPPVTSLGGTSGIDGLRFYPDQETVEQRETPIGIEGYRLQSEALVATEAGQWQLPELVIPWWNTETDALEYARIPADTVIVAGATAALPNPDTTTGEGSLCTSTDATGPTPLWLALTVAGWLLAVIFGGLWWRGQRKQTALHPAQSRTSLLPGVTNRELVPLRLACSENNPVKTRDALLNWGQRYLGSQQRPTLQQLATHTGGDLAEEISKLDAALFSSRGDAASNPWNGSKLFTAVRAQSSDSKPKGEQTLKLYPEN